MTTLLFSVLAATSLAASAVGTPDATRSAQSLPGDHLVTGTANASAAGKFHNVNRMMVGTGPGAWDTSDHAACDAHHWVWSDKDLHCHRRFQWPVAIIGAGTVGGLVYALTSHDNSGASSGQPSISN